MVPPKLRSPLVLVHGLCGFNRFRIGNWTVAEYFPGLQKLLEKSGNRVLIPSLSPTRGIAERAAELKTFLKLHSPNDPVHILAHSMGGLDSRYMISKLGMNDHVLSLTTLGTPHHGSSFADWGITYFSRIVQPVLSAMKIPSAAFKDLTTASCKRFNATVLDASEVRYFSIAGEYDPRQLRPEWMMSCNIVAQREGPNDGLVSVQSASYGENLGIWPGDHMLLANWNNSVWPSPSSADQGKTLFAKIIGRLAEEGF